MRFSNLCLLLCTLPAWVSAADVSPGISACEKHLQQLGVYRGIKLLREPLTTRTHRKQIHYLNGVLEATGEMLSFVCTTNHTGLEVLEIREFDRIEKAIVGKGKKQ